MSKINFNVELDIDDVVGTLCDQLTHDQMTKLIIDLDAKMENWNFTMDLFKHFENLKKQYDKEVNNE